LAVDWDALVAGSTDKGFFIFLADVGQLQESLEVLSELLLDFNWRLRQLFHGSIDEGFDLTAWLTEEGESNLVEDWVFWEGGQDLGDGHHANFWAFTDVLEDWQEHTLDLLWHDSAETTERVDGLHADEWVFTVVADDLLELVDGGVQTSVSEGLEEHDLFVAGLELVELLHGFGNMALLEFAVAEGLLLFNGVLNGELLVAEISHKSADGEPADLTAWSMAVADFIFAQVGQDLDLFLGWSWEVFELDQGTGGTGWLDVLAEGLLNQDLDGVVGASVGEGIDEDVFSLELFGFGKTRAAFLEEGEDLAEFFLAAHAENIDEAGVDKGGFGIDSLDLVGPHANEFLHEVFDFADFVLNLKFYC
jgi:hypothetical protein